MNALPVFSLFAFIVMLVLLPILFGEPMTTSLGKLHLSPEMALLLMIEIIVGGLVNIPVKRIAHDRVVPMHPLAVFGLDRFWPEMRRERRDDYRRQLWRLRRSDGTCTVSALSLGDCGQLDPLRLVRRRRYWPRSPTSPVS